MLGVALTLAAFGGACAPLPTTAPSTETASKETKMTNGPFNLKDEEFWGSTNRSLSDLARHRLEYGKGTVLLDCPKRISVDERQTFPALIYRTDSGAVLEKMPFEGTGLIVAINLDAKDVRSYSVPPVNFAFMPPRDPNISSFGGESASVELRGALNLDWWPSRYRVYALVRDHISDPCDATLTRGTAVFHDPEAERYIANARAARLPRVVRPTADSLALAHGKQKDSPVLTQATGIAISVPRVMENKAGATAKLAVSLRMVIAPTDVVGPNRKGADVGDAHAKAVVPVSVVLMPSDLGTAIVKDYVVPAYDDVAGTPTEPIATAYFTVDLLRDELVARNPQTYFVYVFAGAEMAGPSAIAIVDSRQIK